MRGSCRGRAAGLRPGCRSDRDGSRLDLEDEAAVRAGVDDRGPPEAAHRADDGELVVVDLATHGSRGRDQAIAPAVGESDLEDRLSVGADLVDPRPLLEDYLGARLPRDVDERA